MFSREVLQKTLDLKFSLNGRTPLYYKSRLLSSNPYNCSYLPSTPVVRKLLISEIHCTHKRLLHDNFPAQIFFVSGKCHLKAISLPDNGLKCKRNRTLTNATSISVLLRFDVVNVKGISPRRFYHVGD